MTTILIVDDKAANLAVFQHILERQGYEVMAVKHGAAALEVARRAPPDLIITDILMPVMDGFALCHVWQQDARLRTIPFIFYTGTYTTPTDQEFGLSLGAARYLIKPAKPPDLIKIMGEVLDEFETKPPGDLDLPAAEEVTYLKGYSEVLVRKLESKIEQLEATNQALEQEIAERHRAEQSLRRERDLVARVMETSPISITVVNREGLITFANPQSEIVLGLKKDKITDLSYNAPEWCITDFDGQPFPQAQLPFGRVMNTGQPVYDVRYAIEWPDGRRRFLSINAAPLFDAAGEFDGMVAIMGDITELKQAEQRRVDFEMEKERTKVLRYFISNASHDLRTPLTTIKTTLYLLSQHSDPDKQQRHVEILEIQTAHLERLLEDMLNLSRLDKEIDFKFEPLDLNALIRDVIVGQQSLAQRMNHCLTFTGDPAMPPVCADEIQLDSALTNLVVNALHYTPNGGTITVQTYQHDDCAIIEVRDNGIGIGAEHLPRIFDRFYRVDKARPTATGGAGLGLAIAKRIIEAHYGRIDVESEPGVGSTFRVCLPIDNDTA